MTDPIKTAIAKVRDETTCWADLYYHANILADRINELETLLNMRNTDDAKDRRRTANTGSQSEQRDDG